MNPSSRGTAVQVVLIGDQIVPPHSADRVETPLPITQTHTAVASDNALAAGASSVSSYTVYRSDEVPFQSQLSLLGRELWELQRELGLEEGSGLTSDEIVSEVERRRYGQSED